MGTVCLARVCFVSVRRAHNTHRQAMMKKKKKKLWLVIQASIRLFWIIFAGFGFWAKVMAWNWQNRISPDLCEWIGTRSRRPGINLIKFHHFIIYRHRRTNASNWKDNSQSIRMANTSNPTWDCGGENQQMTIIKSGEKETPNLVS